MVLASNYVLTTNKAETLALYDGLKAFKNLDLNVDDLHIEMDSQRIFDALSGTKAFGWELWYLERSF